MKTHVMGALMAAAFLTVTGVGAAGQSTGASAGAEAFAAGNFDAAAEDYAAALAADPSDPDAALGSGTVELYRNQIPSARKHLQRAIKLAPTSAVARARLIALERRTSAPSDYHITFNSAIARIPFVGTEPVPTIHAKIDGVRMTLAIDTGGPNIDLSQAIVEKLHMVTKTAGEGIFAGGLRAPLRSLYIDRFEAGGVVVQGIPGGVMPGGLIGVDGVVGTDFLYHFLSTIDYTHDALILRPAADSASFQRAASTSNHAVVPFWMAGDHMIVTRAHVNAAPEALFVIDTGGPGIGVDLTAASLKAAGITPEAAHAQTMLGGGGPTRALPFTAASVTMGSVTRHDVPGVYLPDAKSADNLPFAVGGRISQEFFRHMAVTFDFRAMAIVLE